MKTHCLICRRRLWILLDAKLISKMSLCFSRPSRSKIIRKLKTNMPFASSFGKENFERLLHKQEDFQLPDISSEKPELMNPSLLFLLSLNSNKILNRFKIEKLYSSSSSGFSFHKLVIAIKGYYAPVVFLIRNRYNTIEKLFKKNRQHRGLRSLH